MEHILQSLEQNMILSDEIVLDIKQSIRRNHPSADSKFRARLLAQSLHDKLDEHLNGLSDSQKTEVRFSIIKNSLEASSMNISQKDIVQELAANSELSGNDLFMFIADWFNVNTDTPIEYDQLHSILSSIHPDVSFDPEMSELPELVEVVDINEPMNTISARFIEHFNGIIADFSKVFKSNYYKIAIIFISFIILVPALYITQNFVDRSNHSHSMTFVYASSILLYQPSYEIEKEAIVQDIFYREAPGYPSFLEFDTLDYKDVIIYLHSRNSSFTSPEYLDVIHAVAEEYNVHPLLLLAIIGQEQGFVPRDNPYATRILNNPFNVYNSWTKYNTDLKDSCEVAAGTIRNILKERPVGENPFRWLNTRYAEDPNWWKGVQELFYTLLAHTEQ